MTQEKLRDLTQEELNVSLRQACKEGDLEKVKDYIQAGAAINFQDEYGWTPLHWSRSNGHTGVAKFLIKEGAVIDTKANEEGWTPLDLATWNKHTEIITLFKQAMNREAA